MRKNFFTSTMFLLISFAFGSFYNQFLTSIFNSVNKNSLVKENTTDTVLNAQTFFNELKKEKVLFPKIVVAQAILESDSFQYECAIRRNNFLGMFVPAQRYYFGNNPEDIGSYAEYDDWRLSVKDYKSWQQQNIVSIRSRESYLNLLQKIYAKDPRYKTKLIKILQSLDEILI